MYIFIEYLARCLMNIKRRGFHSLPIGDREKKNVTRQMFSVVLLQSSTTGGRRDVAFIMVPLHIFFAMGCSVWLRYDSGCFVLKLAPYGSFLLCSLSALRNSRWKSTPAVVSPKGMPHHTPTAPKPKRKAKA